MVCVRGGAAGRGRRDIDAAPHVYESIVVAVCVCHGRRLAVAGSGSPRGVGDRPAGSVSRPVSGRLWLTHLVVSATGQLGA